MLQLVHDVAPGAQLGFASAFNGQLSFAENILALRSQFHADVIVDDTSYPDEPMYSDGIIAQAVDLVRQAGAAYFSSAGNNGLEAYEAEYRPISLAKAQQLVAQGHGNVHLDQIPAAIRPKTVHDFRNSDGSVSITQRFSSAGSQLSFEWDEPFFVDRVKTNFVVYVFDKDGNFLDPNGSADFPGFYTTDNNVLTDEPFQFIFLPPSPTDIVGGVNITDYQLVIGNVNGGSARHIKYINNNSLGVSERQNAPSVFGHAAARGARAVAATYYAIPQFTEDFSSPGPVTIYLDTQGHRLREPEVRFVPQLTAADGVDTTFFGGDTDGNGFPNFFGTSAAAPNAAAVAALVLEAAGGPGRLSPERLYRRLERTATPIPLPDVRWFSAATAGPVTFEAIGDFTRWDRDFALSVKGESRRSVSSVAFDTTAIGLEWNPNPDRFSVGEADGVSVADITHVVSADASTFTIGFGPKTFRSGDSFRFGMSVFAPIQGGTQEDPDRFRGMKVKVTLDDGTVFRSTVFALRPERINRYAGFGLINADRATRFNDDDD
jgi:subtilisin family serine protease